jgi:membrane fusion protein, copper/silver efflux system
MRRLLNVKFPLVMLLVMLVAFGCSEKKTSGLESLKYTCPMHPEIVKEEPGVCPICKMDLEPVYQHSSQGTSKGLNDSTKASKLQNVKFIRPLDTVISTQERATGIIAYNTNSFRQISARVNGRIEQLYVRYNYQPVSKGQKIMEVYSPEIASAAQELLFLKKERESKLLEAAKKKLYLLGLSTAQVTAMLRNGKVDYSVAVYSPYSGFIMETKNIEPTRSSGTSKISSDNSASGMGGMSSGNSQRSAPGVNQSENSGTPLLLREGQYVSAGQKLFSIVSTEMFGASSM